MSLQAFSHIRLPRRLWEHHVVRYIRWRDARSWKLQGRHFRMRIRGQRGGQGAVRRCRGVDATDCGDTGDEHDVTCDRPVADREYYTGPSRLDHVGLVRRWVAVGKFG